MSEAAPLYLAADNRGVALLLAEKFKEAGVKAEVTERLPASATHAVFLKGINRVSSVEEALEINKEAFINARILGKNLFQNATGLLATVQDTGGCFGLNKDIGRRAWLAGVGALAKTADKEWGSAHVRAVDIECEGRSENTIAERLFKELMFGGLGLEVAINKKGERFITRITEADESGDPNPLRDGDVILVSGGGRGVTAACLKELSKRGKFKFALLGRTEVKEENDRLKDCQTDAEMKRRLLERYKKRGESITPVELGRQTAAILAAREIQSTIEELKKNGCEALYFQADVSDKAAATKAFEQIRSSLGPIKGVVHAAGVLADKYIHQKSLEQFNVVFNSKVKGLLNLLEAGEQDDLSRLCCFSSVAARTGNVGQSDYAMANEILNKVCQSEYYRRKGRCSVKSLGWGPWEGGMVSPSLKKHFEEQGVALIGVKSGAETFLEEFEDAGENTEVIINGGQLSSWEKNLQPNNDKPKFVDIRIQSDYYPFVNSHIIQGKPVVPLMLAHDWGLRLLHLLYSDVEHVKAYNIRAHNRLALDNFDRDGDWIRLCYQTDEKRLTCDFAKTVNGKPALSLTMEASSESVREPEMDFSGVKEEKSDLSFDKVYTDILFHGPDLQVIKNIKGISSESISTVLAPAQIQPKDKTRWKSDIPLLDGGFQTAGVRFFQQVEKKSVPGKIDSMVVYNNSLCDQEVVCRVFLPKMNKLRARGDMFFINSEGGIIAEARGVDLFVLNEGY